MAGRRLVDPQIWVHLREIIKDPGGEDAAIVYLAVWTGPHSTLIGMGRLPLSYLVEDFSWPLDRVQAAMDKLSSHELLAYDPQAKVFWLPAVLRTQGLQNPRSVLGAERVLESIPATPLLNALYDELLGQTEERPYLQPLLERLKRRLILNGNGNVSSDPAPSPTPSPAPAAFEKPSHKPFTEQPPPSANGHEQALKDLAGNPAVPPTIRELARKRLSTVGEVS